jgi:hypothetical protein
MELARTIKITIGSKPSPFIPDKPLFWWGCPSGFNIITVFAFRKRSHEPRQAGIFELDNITSRDVQVFKVFRRDFVQNVRAITMPK